jgi:RNA polymerase sigma-70 factor, ECF subfamily
MSDMPDIALTHTPGLIRPEKEAGSKIRPGGLYAAKPLNRSQTGAKVISETSPTDSELMQRIKAGDKRAFASLSERHAPRAWRIAARFMRLSEDAEEAVQDAFTRVWVKAVSFDETKASFSTWFYTILTRQCLDRLRKRKPDMALSDDMADRLACDAPTAEAEMITTARQVTVRRHIDALPERQRTALILCYLEGLSQAEAARIMNLHIKALEGLLHRAKLKLKEGLAPHYDE